MTDTVDEAFGRVYGMSWHTQNGAEPEMILGAIMVVKKPGGWLRDRTLA